MSQELFFTCVLKKSDILGCNFSIVCKSEKGKKNYTTIPVHVLCICPHIFTDDTHYQLQDSAESSLQCATNDGVGRGDR